MEPIALLSWGRNHPEVLGSFQELDSSPPVAAKGTLLSVLMCSSEKPASSACPVDVTSLMMQQLVLMYRAGHSKCAG